MNPATAQSAADKATPSNLATDISLYFENTTDHAAAIDHIIEAHSRVVCSYCGDATVESMAVKDGVWTTEAQELMQAHLLACSKRPERKLLDIIDAQSAGVDALVTAAAFTLTTPGMIKGRDALTAALAQVSRLKGEG